LRVWKKRVLSEEKKLRKAIMINELERTMLLEEVR
jgi:hypothetical protein